ncbi:MAG: hypothetical protein H0X62_06440 [Bacteroidetes bacterium]|nr:hypothetical protein [Bacteroidota bacterium]
MKRNILQALSFVIILLVFQGCKSSLQISVLQPAEINLPPHFEKLAVAHRHKASQENILTSILDGILSGGVGLLTDKEAGQSCLGGLKNALLKTPRYVISEPAGLDLRGTGTGVFASPLEWQQIESICVKEGADALIVLEVFDTKSALSFKTVIKKVKNKDGEMVDVPEQVATLRMNVTSGWRIYDYKNRMIVDEFRGTSFLDFSGRGTTTQLATAALINGRDAVNRAAFNAGNIYGYRIAPQWIQVTREYYTKGSPSLKRAGRMAKTGDWKGAAEVWEKYSASVDKKISMRSTFNMAIAHEVKGDLDEALIWARKCYKDWGNRKALNYSRILQNRIIARDRVEEQMR